jgi:hypothetical protein
MTTYLHKDDVVDYLFELAASEETDTRNRIEQAAMLMREVGNNNVGINNAPLNPHYVEPKKRYKGPKKC